MKNLFITIILFAISMSTMSQIKSVSLTTAAGYTLVNINEAVGVNQLEDWGNFGLMIKASADFQLNDNLILVGEAGTNRLYSWEYYWNDGYYEGWRYGSDWTTNLGVHIKTFFGERLFVQAGIGLHRYNDGSGIVFGDVVQLGYNIPVDDNISIPVLFRIENVMGNGFPISFMLGSGVSFNFNK
jgi:hypothetical protein